MSYLDQVLNSAKQTAQRTNEVQGTTRNLMTSLMLQKMAANQASPAVTPPAPTGGLGGPSPVGAGGVIPPGGANAAVELAKKSLGVPYRWGGNNLATGVDCSGLVQQVYARLGIHLPRTAALQAKAGVLVPPQQARPGDLVSFVGGRAGKGADHIGIYAGNGMMVVAPHTGDVVKMQPVSAIGEAPTYTRVPGHPAPVPRHA